MRLCMGSRRGFICRMKVGNLQTTGDMAAAHGLHRMKQRNSLGPPARDGQNYAVVHCTGYIKNWPPTGEFDHGFQYPRRDRRDRVLLTSTTTTSYQHHRPLTVSRARRDAPAFRLYSGGDTRRARGIRTNPVPGTRRNVYGYVCAVN